MSISVAPKFNPASVTQDLLPGQTCAFDVGSITLQWRSVYLNQFLSLLSTGGIERRLKESSGDVQITDNAGVVKRSLLGTALPSTLTPTSIPTIGSSLDNALADHIHGMDTTTFDGRYIKRSPTGENQAILPLTDNIGLTIQSFAGGASDILQIINNTGALRWSIGSGGFLISHDARIDIFRVSPALSALNILLTGEAFQRIVMLPTPEIDMGPGGAVSPDTGILRGGAGIIKIAPGVLGWPASTLAQLALLGNETSAAERRIRENAGNLEVLDTSFAAIFTIGPTGATTILPTASVIPLTVKGFAGGTVDVLDIYDSSSPQNLFWKFLSNANLQIGLDSTGLSPAITFVSGLTISQLFMRRSGSGVAMGASSDSPGINWTFTGDIFTLSVTLAKLNTMEALNLDLIYDASSMGSIVFGSSARILNLQSTYTITAGKIRVANTFFAPTRTLEVVGSLAPKVNPQTANYTILLTDTIVPGDATAGSITFTLPSSASAGANSVGMIVLVQKKDSTANTVTIAAAGTDTIELSPNIVLTAQFQWLALYTDGSGTWYILSSNINVQAANVSVPLNATSITVSFGETEPNTSYEVATAPSWNTPVWYTSKTTTGFTINFSTAAPMSATVDWAIRRSSRT